MGATVPDDGANRGDIFSECFAEIFKSQFIPYAKSNRIVLGYFSICVSIMASIPYTYSGS